ncbi:hypothetical protein ZWY2020_048225 [Hordeum vulgare]|nr:hypothetical protein ZWY2020_048225 [Hordeum vulgare]
MAGRRSERINWDDLGNEADEDASEMNYEYEWVVPDHDTNENGGVGDSVEHVEEQHADNNVQGDGNGGASGANGTLIRKRRWYQLHEKHAVYAMVLERTEAGSAVLLSSSLQRENASFVESKVAGSVYGSIGIVDCMG